MFSTECDNNATEDILEDDELNINDIRNNSKIDEGRASIIAALNIKNEHLKSLSIKTDEPDSTLKIKELTLKSIFFKN